MNIIDHGQREYIGSCGPYIIIEWNMLFNFHDCQREGVELYILHNMYVQCTHDDVPLRCSSL